MVGLPSHWGAHTHLAPRTWPGPPPDTPAPHLHACCWWDAYGAWVPQCVLGGMGVPASLPTLASPPPPKPQSVSKSAKMLHYVNFRMKVTIQDGRTLVGTLMAFDKFMNLVLGDCEESRRIKSKKAAGGSELPPPPANFWVAYVCGVDALARCSLWLRAGRAPTAFLPQARGTVGAGFRRAGAVGLSLREGAGVWFGNRLRGCCWQEGG
jgi:small nuclear ribonucleoprotein (snRNP)-like protein